MHKVLQFLIMCAYVILILRYVKLSVTSKSHEEIELKYMLRAPGTLMKILRQIKTHSRNKRQIGFHSYKREKMPTDIKFILKWNRLFHRPDLFTETGQTAFVKSNCEYINCFFSYGKSLLIDPSYYDAILFDVETFADLRPVLRSFDQKYIFSGSEPSEYFPICDPIFDSYYNLTWTYKLDSDIRWSQLIITDLQGKVVGSKVDMKWVEPMKKTPMSVIHRLAHKRKAAAWFVMNCKTISRREEYAHELINALRVYDYEIDTYGDCGKKKCPEHLIDECLELLEQQYFFYLSFEDTISDDYVSEKLLYPLLYYTVPIVYGGANYSRFLPPGSYINARELNATQVAHLVHKAVISQEEYQSYFKWHNHYVYKEKPDVDDICNLCKVLNEREKTTTVKHDFRKWWTMNFEETCKDFDVNRTKIIK